MTSQLRVLVIGGVACGPKAAARLKRLKPEAEVTLIEKDSLVSYGACGLPYLVEGLFSDVQELINTPVGVPRTPEFFKKAKGVQVLTQTEAVEIDKQKKAVRIRSVTTGSEQRLPYDKLVLATGGYSARPPIPGLDLEHVWFMTHPRHAESLIASIEEQPNRCAVLVGAGFINIEMAEALARRGIKVTIVEMLDQIMPGILDKDIAIYAAKHLRDQGIDLILGERVTALEGKDTLTGVKTDRQTIPADLAVVAVGTRPNTELAKKAGLVCNQGIIVNEYGQTSDPDIYAGGDCVENRYATTLFGRSLFVPLGSTANKHGRVIANHIAGVPTPFSGITCTSVVRAFDFTMGRTGISEAQAKELKLDVAVTTWSGTDKPHYMPDAKPFIIKMIASRRDRKLLGLQVAGMGDSAKRLDVAASVILLGGTLDQVANIDFAYAPPYGPPLDPLATCAHILTNKLDGIAFGISALEAKKRIEQGNVVLLDVRMPAEVQEVQLPFETVHIPLGALRDRLHELPKNKEILAFCKVSMRGYEAQLILNAAGYEQVSFIEGGLVGWPYELLVPTNLKTVGDE
ncbi:MAG: FAD-dependent oxidoreductase [Deltaproteobacteria bacterium]|nr:FAD-dependent oxidoreductase [Deltaproteobacteria bacterium]